MRLRPIVPVIACCTVACGAEPPLPADPGLLFALDYEHGSLVPHPALGDPACLGFGSPDLLQRLFPGVGGSGGSLKLTNREYCQYAMPGNFDAQRGTISLWVSPQNWQPSEARFQIFFTARGAGWTMIVYKHYQGSRVLFYLEMAQPPDGVQYKHFRHRDAVITDAVWKPGTWHKLDATWDLPGRMALAIDGTPVSNDYLNAFTMPASLPPAPSGCLYIGTDPRWRENPYIRLEDETAIDAVRVYNRVLSDAEIRDGYQRAAPAPSPAGR